MGETEEKSEKETREASEGAEERGETQKKHQRSRVPGAESTKECGVYTGVELPKAMQNRARMNIYEKKERRRLRRTTKKHKAERK